MTLCRFRSGSKQFDSRQVFLKESFEKVNFGKKKSADNKNMKIYQECTFGAFVAS